MRRAASTPRLQPFRSRRPAKWVSGALMLAACAHRSLAADFYWRGDVSTVWSANTSGNTNFSSNAAGTIDSGALPGVNDTVRFAATTTANLTTTLGLNFSILGLTTESTLATPASVSGNTLTLGSAGIVANSPTTFTIASALASSAGPYAINAAVAGATVSITGSIAAGTTLTKTGPGLLILNGADGYTAGTTLNGGTLQINAASSLPSGKDVTLRAGTLDLRAAATLGNLTFGDGTTSGNPRSLLSGSGTAPTLTLNGNLAFNGPGASAIIQVPISLPAGQHQIISNTSFSSDFYDITLARTISGAGGLTTSGSAYLAFGAANTYTGPTSFSGALVYLGAANALPATTALTLSSSVQLFLNPATAATGITPGNYSQTVASLAGDGIISLGSATLTVGDANSTLFSGNINGTGSFVKQGAGVLTLSGNNNYTGATTITGKGAITATSSTAIPVGTALTIGQLSISSSGRLNTGGFPTSISSLTIYAQTNLSTAVDVGNGTLTLTGDISLLNTTAGSGNQFGTTIAASAGGTLDLGGAVRNITLAGQNISQNELAINAVITHGGINLTANTSTFNGTPAGMVLNASTPNTYAGGTTVNAGVLTVNSTTSLGAPSSPLTLNTTGAVPSTVVINGNQAIGNLSTGSLGTALATVQLNPASSLTVSATGNTFYSGVLTGPGALTKSGSGGLVLFDSNTYTGPTTIAQGALQFGLGGALTTLPSGNFIVNGQLNFQIDNPATLVLSNAFSGTGRVLFSGPANVTDHGSFQLVGTNTSFAGTFQLGAGGLDARLIATGPQNLGPALVEVFNGGGLFLNGGTYPNGMNLRGIGFNESGGFLGALHLQTATATGTLNLAANARITATGPGASTISGPITGAFALEKTGDAALILSGTNLYTGGTTITAGTIQLGSSAGLPTGRDVAIPFGILDLNGNQPTLGNLTFGDGGTGSTRNVVNTGAAGAKINLNGALAYNGPGAPALVLVDIALSSGQHNINIPNSMVSSSASYDLVLSGAISGSGGLTVTTGALYVALNHSNTYAGATDIEGGTTFAVAPGALPAGTALTVNNPATLNLSPFANENGVVAGNYSQTVASLQGSGQILLGTATLTAGNAADTTFSGRILGAGSLVKQGSGALTFTGTNSYSGGSTITAGTLQLGTGGTVGSIVGNVVNNGVLLFNRSNAFTFPGLITGTGVITKLGSGTLTLAPGETSAFQASLLSIATGAVDLTNNDFILTGMTEVAVRSLLTSGSLGSTLATFGSHTALAVITNDNGRSGALYPTFDGLASSKTDILVKYTYQGDTDLNGYVDGNDLANLLTGLSGHLTGWANGDINYDNTVNSTDLTLLLTALRTQGAPLGNPNSPGGAVPEPTFILLLPALAAMTHCRPRR